MLVNRTISLLEVVESMRDEPLRPEFCATHPGVRHRSDGRALGVGHQAPPRWMLREGSNPNYLPRLPPPLGKQSKVPVLEKSVGCSPDFLRDFDASIASHPCV
jgi:hypothetical protein